MIQDKKIALFTFVTRHSIPILVLFFLLGAATIQWYLNKLSESQVKDAALQNAVSYSKALSAFRSLYTSEVVAVARKNGLEVSHDYSSKENAIPLPATLTIMLASQLGTENNSVISKLYSPYPFPWRESTGGLRDHFSKQAWQALSVNPQQIYYRVEEVGGRQSLRYARSDLMRETCIDCHNHHPDTPKNTWKVGDLRGVLEVTVTMDSALSSNSTMVTNTMYLLNTLLLLALLLVWFVIHHLRTNITAEKAFSKQTSGLNLALQQEISIRQIAEHKLLMLAATDPLTEIANRRKFDETYASEWLGAIRSKTSLALIMIDIDNFKAFNDHYGHQEGDRVLREVSATLKEKLPRATDLVARFGGEEFIILLPNTDLAGAVQVALDLLAAVKAKALRHEFSAVAEVVTFSAGVAATIPNLADSHADLLKLADEAMYMAKTSGGNCVKFKNERFTS